MNLIPQSFFERIDLFVCSKLYGSRFCFPAHRPFRLPVCARFVFTQYCRERRSEMTLNSHRAEASEGNVRFRKRYFSNDFPPPLPPPQSVITHELSSRTVSSYHICFRRLPVLVTVVVSMCYSNALYHDFINPPPPRAREVCLWEQRHLLYRV